MSKKQTAIKNELLKLKKWLTVPEAAHHLSILFGEEVDEAGVFRLALEEHLKLSINFVNFTNAVYLTQDFTKNKGGGLWPLALHFLEEYHGKKYKYADTVNTIVKGVWDLIPIGNGRLIIEKKYHSLMNGLL